jgi:hypothetical protein
MCVVGVVGSGLYPQVGKLLRAQKKGDPPCFELKDKTKAFVHPVRTQGE